MNLNKVQKNALDCINLDDFRVGTILATMRSGKTGIAIHLLEKYGYKKILWVCNDLLEKNIQLEKEFQDWGKLPFYKNNFTTVHHKSLNKVDIKSFDIVVFNEMQNITPVNYEYLKDSKRILGLTGTYPNDLEKQKYLQKLGLDNILFNYNIKKAVKDKIISDYKVIIEYVPPDIDKNIKKTTKASVYYTSEEKMIARYDQQLFTLQANIDPLVNLNDKINREIEEFNNYHDESDENKKKLLKLFNKSREMRSQLKPLYDEKKMILLYYQKFINSLDSKINYTKKLFLNQRSLIFASDNAHARKISEYIYSSKTDTSYLDLFNKNEIDHLVLINKGSIGGNYENIKRVIMLAPNKSNTSVLQRIARSFKKNDDGSIVEIYIPYSTEIQLKWILKSIESLDQTKITIKKNE